MTPTERRTSLALAAVYALRMLGLFIVLPVFALQARHYPGGDEPALVGLAMGAYGLTQALLQVPLGMASDRIGRKPVILAGLALFVIGSVVAAWAPSMAWLAAGRALQGAGAISAAVTALLADLTRDSVRTKAMALVGISIALMFALSLVAAPVLVAHSTDSHARPHLADPPAGGPSMLEALTRYVAPSLDPVHTAVHRWTFAKPVAGRPERYLLTDTGVAACGDSWSDKPRVEGAWLSGTALGQALVARLG